MKTPGNQQKFTNRVEQLAQTSLTGPNQYPISRGGLCDYFEGCKSCVGGVLREFEAILWWSVEVGVPPKRGFHNIVEKSEILELSSEPQNF